MASRLAKTPFLQAKRQLAAQAAVATKQAEVGSTSVQVQTSKAGNGLSVVSYNNGSPLTTIGVLVKAGSRYETYDTLGAAHALRNSVGLATKSHSAFGVTRNVQQMGTEIAATVGREYIKLSSQVLSSKIDALSDYLLEVVANPAFKPWELTEVKRRVGIDIADMQPAVRAIELLHKAAYREGLGNSLYSPQYMVGKHGPILLDAFHQKHFTADRACLVAVGDVDHNHLVKLAGLLDLGKGAGPGAPAAKYFGGEQRYDCGGKLAYVSLGADCTGSSVKEIMAGYLLQKVLGVGSRIMHCAGAGQLQKAVGGDVTGVSSFIHDYSDSCLIGASIVCEASNAGQVVSKVAAALRSVSVTDAEVKAAQKALTLELSEKMMNSGEKAEILAACAMYGYTDLMSEKALLDAVAQATVADVQAIAKKLASAKLSMGAVGNLGTVPYADTL